MTSSRRMTAAVWLWLFLLIGSLAGQASPADRLPPSHVIVYDVSGSMRQHETGDGTPRYELARESVRAIAANMRREDAELPTGMVTLGRQYDSIQSRCDDVELAVPVSPIRRTRTLDQIVAEADHSTPRGETPLVAAMVEAAKAMPPEGGTMTVVTDLQFDTVCEADPCLTFKDQLKSLGKPFGTVVKVGWIIATGLRKGVNTQAVGKVAECTGADLIIVENRKKALEAGMVVGQGLLHQTSTKSRDEQAREASLQPQQPDTVGVIVVFDWTNPIVFPDWQFEEINSAVQYFQQRRTIAPVVGNQANLQLLRGQKKPLLLEDRVGLGLHVSREITGEAGPPLLLSIVEPSRLHVEVRVQPGGQPDDDFRYDLTISSGRHVAAPMTNLRLGHTEFAVPPGSYQVTATVQQRSTGLKSMREAAGSVAYDKDLYLRLDVPMTGAPRRGSLIIQSGSPGGRTTVSPNLEVTVKDSAGNTIMSGTRLPLEKSLDDGRYSLTATIDGAKLTATDVVVAANASTRVDLFPPVGRLVLRVQPRPGVIESGDPVAWTVRSTDAAVLAIERNASTLDEALPAGRYEVEVQTGRNGATRKSFVVSAGKITADAISLR